MPKFIVKMPIELNGKLYTSAGAEFGETSSRGSGSAIPVDSSGFIFLTDLQAAQITGGQIRPASPAKPEKPPAKTMGGKNGD